MSLWEYIGGMARAATTSDPFNAIAEPRRREIFALLCEGEMAVNELVASLGWDQPSISKHLRVLREVELVTVRREGRRRIYGARPEALAPVAEWVARFEEFWDRQLAGIRRDAEKRNGGKNP